jgi:hypothetical protein
MPEAHNAEARAVWEAFRAGRPLANLEAMYATARAWGLSS